MELPPLVEEVARRLHGEGYVYAEAVPIERWIRERWPDDTRFFRLVDGCLKILRAMDGP